ncbi:Cys-tRNA(Pro) deacylase [Brumicola nitratireducens]|uniref:Cys-tRNA(Pro)/Cys-tRNA(Cys) deacylase n=1 Tax=Glaciecola nitratireducens (strain JCM 12485 / KCTC 12276 / FR1064) TaxID=1085623 RepID=G4QMI0_GLANF|nr:Cys-tRNA(Pro) deacylase [Glaciecola nitratireducens]AEP30932.1 regulatory protein [Glaciecola nitratireducens FR1064]
MTPAILFLEKQKASFDVLEYLHDPNNQSFASEASAKLGIAPETVFKTLVVEVDTHHFVVAIVPSDKQLSMKKLAKAASGKKAIMADAKKVESMSGYVLGGVSPFGQKKKLMTVLDISASNFDTIYVSGGRRGLELAISPNAIEKLLSASVQDIAA